MQRYIRNKTKQLLSLLMVLALLCTCLPQLSLPARAEDEPDPLIGADEVVLEENIYSGTRIDTMRMLYRLAGEPEVEDMSCLDQFTDLDPEIYSEEALRAVAWAVSNRITSGTSQTTFGPEQRTTKAQAITFVWASFVGRPAYEETPCPYSDVAPGKYYYAAVMWSLGQTDWLDAEPNGSQFGIMNYIYYYKLFQCEKTDGSRCWKLRIGSQDLYRCGDDLRWSFDAASATLGIRGSGAMWEYALPDNPAPWYRYRNDISAVSLPNTATAIGSWAFADCSGLTEFTIPQGIASLGHDVFSGCTGLQSVTVLNPNLSAEGENPFGDPAFVVLRGYDHSTAEAYADRFGYEFESLGALIYTGACGKEGENLLWSFEPATGILEITGSGEMQDYSFSVYSDSNMSPWHQYCSSITSLYLPTELSSIGDYAFYGCTGLSSVTMPESLSSIGSNAFCNCTGLTSITLPEGLTTIGGYAFSGCTGLNSVILPEGLISVGDYAFSGCTGLDSVILPEGLTTIDRYVFSNCTGLNSVILPKTLSSISSGCFQNCFALKNIKFSKNIAVIGESAFGNCSSLRSVSLPASLNKIEENAFKGCSSLKTVVAFNPDCLVKAREEQDLYDDSGEDLVDTFSREYSETLGVPGQTTIYGIHDSEKENSPEMVYTDENMGPIRDYNRYVESYAKFFGYTFQPLNAFGDVTPGSYYEIPVAWAVANGITSGTGDGKFSPKKTCTREQVMTFLYAAEGKPGHTATESPFTDVKPGKYYYHPVMWAVENKITGGVSSTLFGVGKPCTREQVVAFLWKAAGSPEPESTESPFTDVTPGKYYYKPVLWAVEHGVTSGVSATSFGVGQTCTRAQVVTFLYKVYAE